MEGFYTKDEAANMLGVSVRQINNYLFEKRLGKVRKGRRVWIPIKDVQLLYEDDIRSQPPSPADLHALMDRMNALEANMDVLKMGIGFGAKIKLRSEGELLQMREGFLNDLIHKRWNRKRISEVADELQRIREEEVGLLYRAVGNAAWMPLVDLVTRMVNYVERHPDFPDRGLDVLLTRLIRSRDRFYGMVYASTKVDTGLPRAVAKRVHTSMEMPPDAVETHIMAFIDGLPEK
jgi:hypothetical protein